jgi:hypothetical protein
MTDVNKVGMSAEAIEQTPQEKAVAYFTALAKYYATHPDAPVPYLAQTEYIWISGTPEQYKAIGAGEKEYFNNSFLFGVELIPDVLTLKFITSRANVCTKRVVGTRIVPEYILQGIPSQVIEEHTEEVIEWDCPESLLKAKAE